MVSGVVAGKGVYNGTEMLRKLPRVRIQVALNDRDDANKFTVSESGTFHAQFWCPLQSCLPSQHEIFGFQFWSGFGSLTSWSSALKYPWGRYQDTSARRQRSNRWLWLLHNFHLDEFRTDWSREPIFNRSSKWCGWQRRHYYRRDGNLQTMKNICGVNGEFPQTWGTSVNYFQVHEEEDLFPDSSVVHLLNTYQRHADEVGLATMLQKIGLTWNVETASGWTDSASNGENYLIPHVFFSDTSTKVPSLAIELSKDAKPIGVRLKNYSTEQQEFLSWSIARVIDAGIAISNPASVWACAPLLVPKKDLQRSSLRQICVNLFTAKHQHQVPNIEQEI